MPQNVVLEGGAPWGFRITGGKENNQPISIGRVTPGGKASLANLCRGDVILAIGGVATDAMTLSEGQNAILSSTQQLCFKIERPETRLWSPQMEPFRVNLQANEKELGHFEHKFNVRPRPFGAAPAVVSMETIDDNNNSVSRPATRHVTAPLSRPQPPAAKLQKLPLCDVCGKGIIGPVVHAGEKWRHPACFLCAFCGTELKHRGYYLIEGELYCQEHASGHAQEDR
ncbi:PDZ and LIM domain protein 3 [Gadus morhua]|uniref:PDZ and LIM domain protein 3 n=1 Tax=Gadus morhua TaxID=8049 RepID=UPI0011B7BB68|nr:PDZ and LIM domain protein 3-like [Gadus morhua]